MKELFGSVLQSMYTLFQIQTLESWSEGIARPVLRRRPELVLFFIPYVILVTVGVLNVIVAILVEDVLKQTLVEKEETLVLQAMLIAEPKKETDIYMKNLENITE